MSLNKILFSIVSILALLAAFIGTPRRDDRDLDEIASIIETEMDHITPVDLAEQIRAGKNIRVIDLRDSVSFIQEHILNAKRMSIQQVLNGGIRRNEIAVLYSEGGIHASQAWILLKLKHFDSVTTLLGGFHGWKEDILYPELKAGTTEAEKQAVERRRMLSLFFGGQPVVVSEEASKKKVVQHYQPPRRPQPPVKLKKQDEQLRYQC